MISNSQEYCSLQTRQRWKTAESNPVILTQVVTSGDYEAFESACELGCFIGALACDAMLFSLFTVLWFAYNACFV